MKKIILLPAILCSITLFSQSGAKVKSDIPVVVKEAFQKEYPNEKAKWGREGDGYEAEFKMNGIELSALYDKSGHRNALETTIKTSELPQAVLDYMKKNYPTHKITEAAKTTTDKKVVTYEAEIKKKGKSYDLLFDENGKFLKIALAD